MEALNNFFFFFSKQERQRAMGKDFAAFELGLSRLLLKGERQSLMLLRLRVGVFLFPGLWPWAGL